MQGVRGLIPSPVSAKSTISRESEEKFDKQDILSEAHPAQARGARREKLSTVKKDGGGCKPS